MKKILLIFLVFVSFNKIYSQNTDIEELINIKNELLLKKNEINDSIKNIDAQINYLKSKDFFLNTQGIKYTLTKTISQAKIINKPNVFGDIIAYIPEGSTIKVFDYYNGYWLIEKDSIKGYTHEMYLMNNQQMNNLKKKSDKNEIRKKYGEIIANKIFNHTIWIGMTTDMAELSLGSPLKINSTTGTWGVHEQWVYKNKYLYFENDKLTSWQD